MAPPTAQLVPQAIPPLPFSLNDTLGAALLGTVATSVLYGITVVQTYIYYKRNVSDPIYLKSLIFFLWVLDSVHLAFITHAIYFYGVTNFANPIQLAVPTWSILAHIVITGFSDITVRCVFCQRVWKFSNKNWPLAIAILVSSLVVFSGNLAFSVKSFGVPSFAAFAEIADILYVGLTAGLIADLLIAVSMCVLLARRRTGFKRTDSIVRVLMLYSINTGALTSLCALLCLVTYACMPDNYIFIAFFFVLPKLLLNSMLATLNARRPLRDANPGGIVSIPLSSTSSPPPSGRPQYGHSEGRDDQVILRIQVDTATDVKADSDSYRVGNEASSWGYHTGDKTIV